MDNERWYSGDDWYAPLEENKPEVKAPAKKDKKKKKSRKWIAFSAIFAVVTIIVASSVIIGSLSEPQAPMQSPTVPGFGQEPKNELPDDFRDFFEDYYTSTQTDKSDVRVPKYEKKIIFRMKYSEDQSEELSLQELYSECVGSVVVVTAYKKGSAGYSWGSGFIISKDGFIVTNAHVIEDTDRAVITLYDDSEYEATLVGSDAISDIAVLKIEATGLTPVKIGSSDALSVGDKVAAIGNPLTDYLKWTLTDGVVSAISRGINVNGRVMTLLQTNTAINSGNSGGPLFNMYGQVIGITNMKLMSSMSSIEGIGFAIPTATVIDVVNSLLDDGVVQGRTSIGITVGEIPPEAKEKYSLPDGLYVSDVAKGSDAYKKGMKVGDVILTANGESVTANDKLRDIKDKLSVGDTMTFTIWRNGETLELEVTLMDSLDIYG